MRRRRCRRFWRGNRHCAGPVYFAGYHHSGMGILIACTRLFGTALHDDRSAGMLRPAFFPLRRKAPHCGAISTASKPRLRFVGLLGRECRIVLTEPERRLPKDSGCWRVLGWAMREWGRETASLVRKFAREVDKIGIKKDARGPFVVYSED